MLPVSIFMATLFIADLHLSVDEPAISACFFDFLATEAVTADALYILGDLFEFWIGDDDPKPLYKQVARALKTLSEQGVPIYFIHGNRDFMVGNVFAKQAGVTLLPDAKLIDLYGTPTLIMHGDTLCTQDEAYQRYRKKVHNKPLQWLFRRLPLSIRQNIGNKIRQNSHEETPQKKAEITDVCQTAIDEQMRHFHATRLIHGHTHKPTIHPFTLDGQALERIVLGDWYQQGSVLVCDEHGCRLETRAFN